MSNHQFMLKTWFRRIGRLDLWSPDGFKTWLLQLLTPSNYSLYSSIGYFCHRLPSITFLYQHLCKISFTDGFKLYDNFIFVEPSISIFVSYNIYTSNGTRLVKSVGSLLILLNFYRYWLFMNINRVKSLTTFLKISSFTTCPTVFAVGNWSRSTITHIFIRVLIVDRGVANSAPLDRVSWILIRNTIRMIIYHNCSAIVIYSYLIHVWILGVLIIFQYPYW